jgi:O-antigen/teichoic acid export membrane protein
VLRNIGSNLVGTILPAAAALVAVPLLVGQLGMSAFGIFSMQVAALFFFGLSDFGISRAIVLFTFDERFAGAAGSLRPYRIGLRYSAALAVLTVLLGAPVSGALYFWHPQQVTGADIALSTALVFVSAAAMLLSLAPRAVLEAQQRFLLVNLIRGPSAAAIFIAPLAAFMVSKTLVAAALGILLTRIISTACYFLACRAAAPSHVIAAKNTSLNEADLRAAFLRKAGWLGLTNMLSMLVAYIDRFILGAFGSAAMVGQYVIAQEVVTKMWIASGAVISAAMPRLASERDVSQGAPLRQTTRQLVAIMWVVGVLPAAILILFGGPILKVWLRGSFDPATVLPLKVMAAGLGVNNLTQINFSLLQVHGGERGGAFLQVFHVLFLCAAVMVLVPPFGVNGVAVAFTARLMVDSFLVRRLLSSFGGRHVGVGGPMLAGCAALLLGLLLAS